MIKSLVIVESPEKAKTINRYLGNKYIVKSSIGHICDLSINDDLLKKQIVGSSSNQEIQNKYGTLIIRMGINPWNNWEAYYAVLPNKEKIISELKKLAKKSDYIYLATDLDREGEAIAWHLREIIGGDNRKYGRVIFNEITKKAILQAFKKPIELNIDRVNAQRARRFMDRIVGYMVSPLLWKKVSQKLSAGRVQSVAVRLIVEHEKKIKSFLPREYWEIYANVRTPKDEILLLQVTHQDQKNFQPENLNQARAACVLLKEAYYQVLENKIKLNSSNPHAPFITSTLQQSANIYLGFSIKKTMTIAQKLYEAGYITYIRTDSTNLSKNAINMARSYIVKNFDKKYLPEKPNWYVATKNSQEAHEAIRPSNIFITFKELKNMELDVQKLYQLIWCQFISCQMTPAKYDSISIIVSADNFYLKTSRYILRFDGWKKVMNVFHNHKNDSKNGIFPEININDKLSLVNLVSKKKFTKPPVRFSEATLIKELEKRGIGRPSTYASIISTIQNRGYIHMKNLRIYPRKIGEIVTFYLKNNFHELMSYNFTAKMEASLDQIAKHEIDWKTVLDNFFKDFIVQIDKAEKVPKIPLYNLIK